MTPVIMLSLLLAVQDVPDVAPGPEPAKRPLAWQLELDYRDPQRITVQGPEGPETYWYIVYTAINRSGNTQRFYPTFELVDGELEVHPANVGISPLVYDAIEERHAATHPYLVPPNEAIGRIRAGRDNAIQSMAVWRAENIQGNELRIYVGGLSGESRLVKNPSYNPDAPETVTIAGPDGTPREITVNPEHFAIRKTLEIRYTVPGSERQRRRALPVRQSERWIMR